MRKICQKYNIGDPLTLLQSDPESKSKWRKRTKEAITAYHDNLLHQNSMTNSKMEFLNGTNLSVSGPPHPVLRNVTVAYDVMKLRVQVRFLTGDYLTYSLDHTHGNGKSPHCRLCSNGDSSPDETVTHIISQCAALQDVRNRLFPEILDLIHLLFPDDKNQNSVLLQDPKIQTQYILDCTSPNLPKSLTVPMKDLEKTCRAFKVTRDFCYAIHKERIRKLNLLKDLSNRN